MKLLSKFTQLNAILDIEQPRYSRQDVLIACWKVKRSKLDIKLRFSKVGETSEYAGDWFLSRKKATPRRKIDNQGLPCYAIPWALFEPLVIAEREII